MIYVFCCIIFMKKEYKDHTLQIFKKEDFWKKVLIVFT
jgi:hypothetical protein